MIPTSEVGCDGIKKAINENAYPELDSEYHIEVMRAGLFRAYQRLAHSTACDQSSYARKDLHGNQ